VRDVLPGAADHDDEFRLVIDLLGDLRDLDRVAVGDEGVGELAEHDGFGGDGLAALDGVVAVVEADAEDLAGGGDGRGELDRLRFVGDGRGGGGGLGGGLADGRGGGEEVFDGRGESGVGGVEVDVTVVVVGGGPRPGGGEDGGEAHVRLRRRVVLRGIE